MAVRASTLTTSEIAVVNARGASPRNVHAVAHYRNSSTGREGFAVAAGTTGTGPAAQTASVATDHAVRACAAGADAAAAVLTAREIVDLGIPAGDASLAVVASPRPGAAGRRWTVGWAGDCSVYSWNGTTLAQLTAEHTAAREMRAEIPHPPAYWHRVLTNSIRQVGPCDVGLVRATAPRWIILTTASIRHLLGAERIRGLLRQGGGTRDKAEVFSCALRDVGPCEDATAVIVRCRDDIGRTRARATPGACSDPTGPTGSPR